MKKIYIIGLMSALLCSSCSNFLEKDPSTSLPVESAVTTMKDLRNAVNGIAYIALNGRMCYDADFAIYADLKGEDFKAVTITMPVRFLVIRLHKLTVWHIMVTIISTRPLQT